MQKIPALLPLDKPSLDFLFNKPNKAVILLRDRKTV